MTRRLAVLVAGAALAGALGVSLTASGSAPATRVGLDSRAVSADEAKPAACAGITLTARVSGSGTLNGTAANELLLGSSGDDTIIGGGGDDCSGDGDDTLVGGPGNDVCIAGPGGPASDPSCETQA